MGLRKFAARAAGELSLAENFLIQLPRYPALRRRRKRDEEVGVIRLNSQDRRLLFISPPQFS